MKFSLTVTRLSQMGLTSHKWMSQEKCDLFAFQDGDVRLTYHIYKLSFMNFLLGKQPNGPGEALDTLICILIGSEVQLQLCFTILKISKSWENSIFISFPIREISKFDKSVWKDEQVEQQSIYIDASTWKYILSITSGFFKSDICKNILVLVWFQANTFLELSNLLSPIACFPLTILPWMPLKKTKSLLGDRKVITYFIDISSFDSILKAQIISDMKNLKRRAVDDLSLYEKDTNSSKGSGWPSSW